MIGTLNKTLKVNNEVVDDVPSFLDYSVTYSDGVEIENNHKIEAGTTETYLVRLEFKTDIEELPEAATITTSLEPQYLQADSNATYHPHSLYDVLKTEAETGTLVHEYTGEHKDSFTITGTENIYHWYAENNDDESANTILDKNNVIFANYCWQILRTTDTGGVKLIYNGTIKNGKCNNTGRDSVILTTEYNLENRVAPAYVGYMYNPNEVLLGSYSFQLLSDVLYGNDVVYENGQYTLINTSSSIDATHHFTCKDSTTTCSTVRFYFFTGYVFGFQGGYCYIELSNGKMVNQVLHSMIDADNINQVSSNLKNKVDEWYQQKMTAYTSKLEDTIFCNDRSITSYGGWNKDTSLGARIKYRNDDVIYDLSCPNITDQFSLANEKAQLTYPVGIITVPEANLSNNWKIKKVGSDYFTISPNRFEYTSYIKNINSSGSQNSGGITNRWGVRPVISLAPGTKYGQGDGSKNNPYIIE